MGSGRSFYYYGYGSWDLTKKILLMKPLKGVEKKINKLHLYKIFQQKKTSFGAMTDSVVMILQTMSFL